MTRDLRNQHLQTSISCSLLLKIPCNQILKRYRQTTKTDLTTILYQAFIPLFIIEFSSNASNVMDARSDTTVIVISHLLNNAGKKMPQPLYKDLVRGFYL